MAPLTVNNISAAGRQTLPIRINLAIETYFHRTANQRRLIIFCLRFGIGLAITLAVSLAVYMLVRAIGWVIGGFASS